MISKIESIRSPEDKDMRLGYSPHRIDFEELDKQFLIDLENARKKQQE